MPGALRAGAASSRRWGCVDDAGIRRGRHRQGSETAGCAPGCAASRSGLPAAAFRRRTGPIHPFASALAVRVDRQGALQVLHRGLRPGQSGQDQPGILQAGIELGSLGRILAGLVAIIGAQRLVSTSDSLLGLGEVGRLSWLRGGGNGNGFVADKAQYAFADSFGHLVGVVHQDTCGR